MKEAIKHFLAKYGLFSKVDLSRRMLQITNWACHGCRSTAPPPIKRMVLASYIKDYGLKHFVETGTHLGDTLADIAHDTSILALSIELDAALYNAAVRRFAGWSNVTLLHGDSGVLMPVVVKGLMSPTLFWLDGHYSGGTTAKSEIETPVSAELQAIFRSPVQGHVILIDDVRCFDGTHDYPHLDELLAIIRTDGRYAIEVSTDILRLTPKQAKTTVCYQGG